MLEEKKTENEETEYGPLVPITDRGIESLEQVPKVLNRIFKSVMEEGTDYGKIPGTPKPSLWKPGAELLANYCGLSAPDPTIMSKEENRDPEHPYFEYVIKQTFFRGGIAVGAGEGAANTRETRYAFRWLSEGQLPKGIDKESLQWRENKNKDGTKWKSYRVPTPPEEIFTLQNTVLKMAKKRSFVDGVLQITGASRIFSQDLEDDEEERIASAKSVGKSEAKPVQESRRSEPQTGPFDLSKFDWWTKDEKGKNRKWAQTDSWGFANITYGNEIVELAKPIVAAIANNGGGVVQDGELLSYEGGQLLRRKNEGTL